MAMLKSRAFKPNVVANTQQVGVRMGVRVSVGVRVGMGVRAM
jgi:hypothetical protein